MFEVGTGIHGGAPEATMYMPQSFDWVYGVPDGEVPRFFVRNPDPCGFPKPPCPRDNDRDPEGGSDRSRESRGKSIWSRIGHQDKPRAIPQNRPLVGGTWGHKLQSGLMEEAALQAFASKKDKTQGSIAEEGEDQGKQVEASEDFNAKLDDFIKQVSAALPQPIPTAPSKKLTALFKQPINPSVVKVIKEMVSFGGGEVLLKGIEK
ncbi:hypothetical protein GUJ93_ZPchr0008g11592 [Zizania palustris]|uniref:Uncharacterized protein n=1 Tax=Zizania palustris TaxID=103762 RepID=A0A8J5RYP5_ZIZPA|nr:hypothetical protein GUJ93_ZPchr0008g11592 [Zizania palustris]